MGADAVDRFQEAFESVWLHGRSSGCHDSAPPVRVAFVGTKRSLCSLFCGQQLAMRWS